MRAPYLASSVPFQTCAQRRLPPLHCARRPRRRFDGGNSLNWNNLNGNSLYTGQSIGSQIVVVSFDGVRIGDNGLDSTSLSGAAFVGHHADVGETHR
jgi:hypothetical protein